MSTELAKTQQEPRSITRTLAHKYDMEPAAFEQTVRATVFKGCKDATREQFAAFCLVCNEYDLNPVLKEIYAFPGKGGGIEPIISIDGWLNIANSHPAFNGMTFQDFTDEKGNLISVTCTIYRKDRSHPIKVTEWMAECKRANVGPWQSHPKRMLRHKSLI